jgi:hypothetical protein
LGMQQLRRHVCKVRVFTINVFAANENWTCTRSGSEHSRLSHNLNFYFKWMQIPGIPYTHGGLTVEYKHRAYTFWYNALYIEWASARCQSVGINWRAFFIEHTS